MNKRYDLYQLEGTTEDCHSFGYRINLDKNDMAVVAGATIEAGVWSWHIWDFPTGGGIICEDLEYRSLAKLFAHVENRRKVYCDALAGFGNENANPWTLLERHVNPEIQMTKAEFVVQRQRIFRQKAWHWNFSLEKGYVIEMRDMDVEAGWYPLGCAKVERGRWDVTHLGTGISCGACESMESSFSVLPFVQWFVRQHVSRDQLEAEEQKLIAALVYAYNECQFPSKKPIEDPPRMMRLMRYYYLKGLLHEDFAEPIRNAQLIGLTNYRVKEITSALS